MALQVKGCTTASNGNESKLTRDNNTASGTIYQVNLNNGISFTKIVIKFYAYIAMRRRRKGV